jgi:hypothetical protein
MRVTLLNRLDVADECRRGTLAFRRVAEPYLDAQPLALVGRARGSPNPTTNLLVEEFKERLPGFAD